MGLRGNNRIGRRPNRTTMFEFTLFFSPLEMWQLFFTATKVVVSPLSLFFFDRDKTSPKLTKTTLIDREKLIRTRKAIRINDYEKSSHESIKIHCALAGDNTVQCICFLWLIASAANSCQVIFARFIVWQKMSERGRVTRGNKIWYRAKKCRWYLQRDRKGLQ